MGGRHPQVAAPTPPAGATRSRQERARSSQHHGRASLLAREDRRRARATGQRGPQESGSLRHGQPAAGASAVHLRSRKCHRRRVSAGARKWGLPSCGETIQRAAEWLVSKPWALVGVVAVVVAVPIILLGELSASDTQRRLRTERLALGAQAADRGAEEIGTQVSLSLQQLESVGSRTDVSAAVHLGDTRGAQLALSTPDHAGALRATRRRSSLRLATLAATAPRAGVHANHVALPARLDKTHVASRNLSGRLREWRRNEATRRNPRDL